MSKKKKVYVCQVCNAYLTKDGNEPTPICCGKAMMVMDELDEGEIYEEKDVSGGL